ncbi:MAG: tetratricopeptide repeat protein [Bacteroidota bacterium]
MLFLQLPLHRPTLAVLVLTLAVLPAALAQPSPPPSPDTDYATALDLYEQRLYGQAARAFGGFAEAHPTHPRHPDALYYGGLSALGAGDINAAERQFDTFREQYPNYPLSGQVRLALGEYYFGADDFAQAEGYLTDALRDSLDAEGAARVRYLLGHTQLELGRSTTALGYFTRTASQYPETTYAPRALYDAGRVATDLGQPGRAADALSTLAEDYAEATENTLVGLALANALARTERYDEAVTELDRRVPTLTGAEQNEGSFLLGEMHVRLADASEAAIPDAELQAEQEALAEAAGAHLDAATTAYTQVAYDSLFGRRARLALGRIAYRTERFDAALEYFSGLVGTLPNGIYDNVAHEADYYAGLTERRLGNLAVAEDRLAQAHERRPTGPYADAALLELGILRYERRRYDPALRAFLELLDAYPASTHRGEASRMLGEAFAALGQFDRAREYADLAEVLGTPSEELAAEVDFQDAYALYAAGDFDEAADVLYEVYTGAPRGPRAAEALFWAADAAFRDGQAGNPRAYALAERNAQLYLQRFPLHRLADAGRYVLGWTYFKQGNYPQAADAFETFLAAYEINLTREAVPYAADARLRLADSYFALGRYEFAVANYSRVRGRGEDYALFQTAQARTAQGDLATALTIYDRLLAEFPQSALKPEARFARAQVLFQSEQYDPAIDAFRALADDLPNHPLAAKALYTVGDAYYNTERLPEAEDSYRAVLRRYPDSPFVADALTGIQFVLLAEGRLVEADSLVSDFVALYPDLDAEALRYRQAEFRLQSGDTEGGITSLETQLERGAISDGQRAEIGLTLARAYANEGRVNDAIDQLTALLDDLGDGPAAAADRFAASTELGRLYLNAGRFGEARDTFEALELDAPDTQAVLAARLGQAAALAGLGRTSDAAEMYQIVIDAGGPAREQALLGLAKVYDDDDQSDSAVQTYGRLLEARDAAVRAEATVRLGVLYHDLGEHNRALSILNGVDQRFSAFPMFVAEGLLTTARAYRELGLDDQAESRYRRVATDFDGTPYAAAARSEQPGL